MSQYGIAGNINNWIKGFLKSRKQRVYHNNVFSQWTCVTSGVPQGTILGPTLFNIYINDIVSGLSSKCKLYADDCILYREAKCETDKMMFQKDLDILYQWSMKKWSFSFNFSKCRTMNISRNAEKMPASVFYMNGNLLENSNSEKYLGLHISND